MFKALICEIYLFGSHSKDENGIFSSSGTTVLLIFDTLDSMQSYIKSVYYNNYTLTLYFQVQFMKVDCIASTKKAIKFALEKEPLSARRERDLTAKKRKYHEDPEKKMQAVKKRYHDKEETIK